MQARVNRATTPAEAALRSAQEKHPPLYAKNRHGLDRVQALAAILALPPALEQARAEGLIACGEIGKWMPDAGTQRLDDRNFVIELTGGHMDFFYAVGRAMAGASVMYGRDGAAKNTQALPVTDVASLTAQTIKDWKKHCQPALWDLFWTEKRIQHARFDLSEAPHDMAETLVTCAELFTLAHEYGHVALGMEASAPAHENEEIAADLAGLDIYVPTAVRLLGERIAFVGPAFAVRITESLARCGVPFLATYPPAAERLDHIMRRLRGFCSSDQYFDEASTIMVANLSFMDDIDRLVVPGCAPATQTQQQWYGRVGTLAALQSVITERRPLSVFLEMFNRAVQGQTPEAARDIARTLMRYYRRDAKATSFFDEALRRAMGGALDECIKLMPNEQQRLFK